MKKFILMFFTIAFGYHAQGQLIVNKVNFTDSTRIKYLKLTGFEQSRTKKSGLTVLVDFGQPVKFGDPLVLTDSNGKEIKWDGHIDAVNFVANHGWELVSFSTWFDPTNNWLEHYYIMKRK